MFKGVKRSTKMNRLTIFILLICIGVMCMALSGINQINYAELERRKTLKRQWADSVDPNNRLMEASKIYSDLLFTPDDQYKY